MGLLSELSYRSEPHDLIYSAVYQPGAVAADMVGRGCTRGGADEGGYWEGLYRYPTGHPPGPIFMVFLKIRPYPRPNEGLFGVFNEVSQTGSKNGSRIDQN